ncbi:MULTISPECIES: hypothetical protein [unclassified Pseudomonas]|uniref:hypothetical protein n=1 Tax=unclassified Pseudomonas TaxID=196821 RepID=UPI0015A12142|nr:MULTISPECIES: hypothetical protein [unclassified Pseudomonas]NWC93820.1 hypothetical protein [Pseudomonas sp. IPO3779]NWD16206.1 hypothetical protein [Pseudomonas sp. IPO3778]
MGDVISIKRKGGCMPPTTRAHIDSYVLLIEILIGFLDLCISGDEQGHDCNELVRLAQQLDRLSKRFTPPKGAV